MGPGLGLYLKPFRIRIVSYTEILAPHATSPCALVSLCMSMVTDMYIRRRFATGLPAPLNAAGKSEGKRPVLGEGGNFVCPHSACFDHALNMFVVEWVEVGRVRKLRKVS